MKVENIAIVLRIRSNWEAIDMGFALARKWFLRLWGAWLISALPAMVIVLILSSMVSNENAKSWIFVLFWWFKPLYEQPLLYILSRQLFSEPVNLRDVFKNYMSVVKPQLGALLLWRRLSFSRSFNNPVAMLENLTGKPRRERLQVLHSQQSSTSQWLTIVCLHIEYFICFALILFIFALIPAEIGDDFFTIFLGNQEDLLLSTITFVTYFVAMSIIAPMYVAAGFALYINRRIKLEGWDLELAFKRMNNRIESKTLPGSHASNKKTSSLVACLPLAACLILGSLSPNNSLAQNNLTVSKETAKQTIEQVLKQEDFGEISTEEEWVFVGNNLEEDEDAPEWLTEFLESLVEKFFSGDAAAMLNFLEVLMWLSIAALVVWLIHKYSHWLTWLNFQPRTKKKATSIPNKILGMEMNKATLPDDILVSFTKLINTQQYREALSLLYRATLSAIVHRGDIEIPSSATELECSEMVNNKRDKDESSFFRMLTQAWILLAYADRTPTEETLSKLRDEWSKHYLSEESRDMA